MTRILVVDSDPDSGRFVELTLELEGFDVEVCSEGQHALNRMLDFRPDLLLLDVGVAGVDGLELTRQVRAHPRLCSIPVIMVTARSLSADRVLGLTAGADDYVTKPCDSVELIARVRSTLRRNAEMRSLSPLTGLPGNNRIEAEMQRRFAEREPFAVCYCDLDGFKAFNDAYGWLRGDDVIGLLASAAQDAAVTATNAGPPPFVGHIGGDDVVVICTPEQVAGITRDIVDTIDRGVPALYDSEDAARGYLELDDRQGVRRQHPLVTVSIGVAQSIGRDISDHRELVAIATEMKLVAKRQAGSTVAVDRRREAAS
jgi:diguanylate cyclase (GGDEF)-like protein